MSEENSKGNGAENVMPEEVPRDDADGKQGEGTAENRDLSFMREKIKKQPFYQRRAVRRLAGQVLAAVLCGAVACFVFVKLYPWMDERFGKEEPAEITIPDEDELSWDDNEEEDGEEGEAAGGAAAESGEGDSSDTSGGQGETEEEADTGDGSDEEETQDEPLELTVEEYESLYASLKEVADQASDSLVTVTAYEPETDWLGSIYSDTLETSGMLVGNNGVEMLILVPYTAVEDAAGLTAEFVDGSEHEAVLKTYDVVSDLAVLSVNLSDVDAETLGVIETAELGSSRYLKAGAAVIAVGSPAGMSGSVKYGNLVTGNYTVSAIDAEYSLLITDIPASDNASGVLLNLDGQVVGLIEDTYLEADNTGYLTAYGISPMKDIIENLSNSQDIVYMGITGTQVTEEIAAQEDIPTGVYVSGVEADSPALEAGIQAGDIITEINGNTVNTMSDIQDMLLLYSDQQVIQVNVMRQGKDEYKEIGCKVTLGVLR